MAKPNNKEFKPSIAGLWLKSSGNYLSAPIDDKTFDALQRIQKGGKLIIKLVDPDTRGGPDSKFPHAFLDCISKDDVEAFAARAPKRPAAPAASDDI